MECNPDDLPVNHAAVEKKNSAKVKPLSASRRRRSKLSLACQSSNVIISSDVEGLNGCQVKVEPEESDTDLVCQKGNGSASMQSSDKAVIKCEGGPSARFLRSTTPVKTKQNKEHFTFNEESRKWTDAEKWQLIDILKKEGYNGDIHKLATQFSRQTVESVRYLLHTMKSSSQDEWEKKLENYIKIVKRDCGKQDLVENCPLFVYLYSKFGKHPCPSIVGGVDYALLYQSIVYFMYGGIPKRLDEQSRAKFHLLVEKFRKNPRNRRKYSIPDEDVPHKKDGKTREDRNEDLANRRRKLWSEEEMAIQSDALSKDTGVVRKFFGCYDCFNPFKLPLD